MTLNQANHLALTIDNLLDAKIRLYALDDDVDEEIRLYHSEQVEFQRQALINAFLDMEITCMAL